MVKSILNTLFFFCISAICNCPIESFRNGVLPSPSFKFIAKSSSSCSHLAPASRQSSRSLNWSYDIKTSIISSQADSKSIVERKLASSICSLAFLILGFSSNTLPSFAIEQQYKLPPIDRNDPNRCNLISSSMGQANAARDKLYDLRECSLVGQSGAGKDVSGMIASNADFTGVNFKEAQLSKALARNSKFIGVDFTNAIVDRVSFDGSDLKGAVLSNAVLSGTTFTDANLEDTDFSDAYLGPFDLRNLCLNPTLKGTNPVTKVDTRISAGCLD